MTTGTLDGSNLQHAKLMGGRQLSSSTASAAPELHFSVHADKGRGPGDTGAAEVSHAAQEQQLRMKEWVKSPSRDSAQTGCSRTVHRIAQYAHSTSSVCTDACLYWD